MTGLKSKGCWVTGVETCRGHQGQQDELLPRKENVRPLLNAVGDLVTAGTLKAEKLNAAFASVFSNFFGYKKGGQ